MKETLPILIKTASYIRQLFEETLPIFLVFHNLEHTENVVKGVTEIGKHTSLSKEEKEIVLVAAWFHDSGHTVSYQNHETISQALAYEFLSTLEISVDFIEKVIGCIEATKIPQSPKNLLQQILCDADLYHLSSTEEFDDYQYLLRTEWDLALNQVYTDKDWLNLNIHFLGNHRYFTSFAQKVWEKRKQANFRFLQKKI